MDRQRGFRGMDRQTEGPYGYGQTGVYVAGDGGLDTG